MRTKESLEWFAPGYEDELLLALETGGPLGERVFFATTPAFASTAHNAAASVSTANTNRDGTGTIATIFTAGASGSKIDEVVVKADADPADSTIVFYLYDGAAYHVYDEWDIGNPAAGSTTVASYREARTYENLILQSGWSLRASITVALTAGAIQAQAFGGDF